MNQSQQQVEQQLALFRKNIGQRFKVMDGDGKPFHGKLGQSDTVIKVHGKTHEIEGNFFIAHVSCCRLVQDQPQQLKQSKHKEQALL
jgi:hypothetical protein